MGGYNEDPNAEQFSGSFRKLMAYDAILCSSSANIIGNLTPSLPFSHILFVSSAPSISKEISNQDVSSAELETLFQKMAEVESIQECALLDIHPNYGIVYISRQIEQRISNKERMYCASCANVFDDNEKLQPSFGCTMSSMRPCTSTFNLCKEADRFMRIQMIKASPRFDTILAGIYDSLNVENLFVNTDFSHNPEHKMYLIRSIIDVYIQIKGTYLAKTATFEGNKEMLRLKLRKLIHAYGQ